MHARTGTVRSMEKFMIFDVLAVKILLSALFSVLPGPVSIYCSTTVGTVSTVYCLSYRRRLLGVPEFLG